jgi:nitrate/nitrite-specific signal transduction histidine kinase
MDGAGMLMLGGILPCDRTIAGMRRRANRGTETMPSTITLSQLKWITIVAPLVFLGVLEAVRSWLLPDLFSSWPGFLLLAGIALLGLLVFSQVIFSVIERLQRQLQQQNDELLALHHASLAIEGQLELQTVLQGVVDEARTLLGARYGALSYLRDDGTMEAFLTSGIAPEVAAKIGPPPKGHGVLGVVIDEGQTLRLDDVGAHPHSVGFPPHHPPMKPLLAVPIRSQGVVFGNLYLADYEGVQFEQSDEETLVRFAAMAAVAIENARLHEQVRALAITEERERIAREMHDSLAQVLGYVNTKVQATQVLLETNQIDKAEAQLTQMAGAARSAYADVREGILSLRTSLDGSRSLQDTLREYLTVWQEQSGVRAELVDATEGTVRLSALAEVQLLRIIQEAMANVRKHAQASDVRIELARDEGRLVARIVDDGIGFDPEERTHMGVPRFGMSTMRERAESLGGDFDVSSTPGKGTCITVRLPLERRAR